MNVILRNIPNAITSLNLISGVIAVIFASQGAAVCGSLPAYRWAFIFIAFSAVADFFDGLCARMMKAYSDLGKQMDSLSDLVSFGVAPGVLAFFAAIDSGFSPAVAWTSLLIPLCGMIRLARFNIDEGSSRYFKGLPIPANAIFWIGLTSWMYSSDTLSGAVFPAAAIIVSLMMISPVRFYSLKLSSLKLRDSWPALTLVAVSVIFCLLYGVTGLSLSICYYFLSSMLLRGTKFKS